MTGMWITECLGLFTILYPLSTGFVQELSTRSIAIHSQGVSA